MAALAAVAFVGSGIPLLVTPDQAVAHGAMTYPATRTYACYVDGRAAGMGDLVPSNPACKAAVEQGGKQPLWDFYAVLIGNAGGRHREIIPDGQLCGAGTAKYAAYNAARTDWPTTDLQPGATINFRYNAWAPHPGTWYQYVTRDGWDPTQPLKWSDLEATPFDQVTNPPTTGGESGSEYYWSGRLPNKSGRHIIYSIWHRSDSPEAFYNCSDVNFGGGGDPTTPPPTTPAATPTGPTPTTTPVIPICPSSPSSPSRSSGQVGPLTTCPPPPPTGRCAASVKVDSSWSGGYQASVTLRNTGTAALNQWFAYWTMPSGNTISQGWNATVSQSGSLVTATAPSWAQSIAAGASVSIGFISSGSPGSGPSAFRLNGFTCDA